MARRRTDLPNPLGPTKPYLCRYVSGTETPIHHKKKEKPKKITSSQRKSSTLRLETTSSPKWKSRTRGWKCRSNFATFRPLYSPVVFDDFQRDSFNLISHSSLPFPLTHLPKLRKRQTPCYPVRGFSRPPPPPTRPQTSPASYLYSISFSSRVSAPT